jgi:hypothetical protein
MLSSAITFMFMVQKEYGKKQKEGVCGLQISHKAWILIV